MGLEDDGFAGITGDRLPDERRIEGDLSESIRPGGALWALASAGPQLRESAALAADAGLTARADEGRPRAV
ncbi:MAG: mannose-6-phosphate isomerase, partial [Glycomyces artemisiae]|nr:mannose-6-phosphate isomerase [Glycomyces artemisiae]